MTKVIKTAGRGKIRKPDKPHKDFPLFAHAAGQWAKKVRGRLHYFGVWAHPDVALKKWNDTKDDLLEGRAPRVREGELRIKDLLNCFLTAKQDAVDAGELSPRSFCDYKDACERIVETFPREWSVESLGPDDFATLRRALAKRYKSSEVLGNWIQRCRTVFGFGFKNELITRPPRYGSMFARPTKKVIRKQQGARGERMIEARRIRKLLKAANPQLRAMVLLGVNCGFGNHDCATLPLKALDLQGGWVVHARPKTGVSRRCPLWPETIAALREAIAQRPQPKDDALSGLVFVTKYGSAWHTGGLSSPISAEFAKLARECSIKLDRQVNFYSLRRSLATIGSETLDQIAVNSIMGHTDESMPAKYRQRIDDVRLVAVTDHVHRWLFRQPADRASRIV